MKITPIATVAFVTVTFITVSCCHKQGLSVTSGSELLRWQSERSVHFLSAYCNRSRSSILRITLCKAYHVRTLLMHKQRKKTSQLFTCHNSDIIPANSTAMAPAAMPQSPQLSLAVRHLTLFIFTQPIPPASRDLRELGAES